MDMRIAHLSVVRQLTQGQTRQLAAETEAAPRLEGVQWTTHALQAGAAHAPFVRQIPKPFRGPLLRNLYAWFVIRRLARENDFVLVRQMPVDLFAPLFARTVGNRASVHHAMETEEHRLIGDGPKRRLAAVLDRWLIGHAVRRAVTVFGVTGQIAAYERDRHDPGKRVGTYPNAISPRDVTVLPDARTSNGIVAAFICGTFTRWHGLDRLIAAVEDAPEAAAELTVHLIGRLSEEQRAEVTRTPLLRQVFEVHGHLDPPAYRAILQASDLGLGSLALDRQNMTEGSTLKTAELLASGLPVYATHADASLPRDFPYFARDTAVDVARIVALGHDLKDTPRHAIAAAALPYVDKRVAMQGVVDHLRRVRAA